MTRPTVPRGADYAAVLDGFSWPVLRDGFNIGHVCDLQPSTHPAIIEFDLEGANTEYTFGQLKDASSRVAGGLLGIGLEAGDRVAILLPQSFNAAVAHLAIYKAGLVAVPLSQLFGPDAIRHRVTDSSAKAVIVDDSLLEAVADIASEAAINVIVTSTSEPRRPHIGLGELLEAEPVTAASTTADTPALIIYTSGTTAEPKGALHAHRALIGHLPGFELSHSYFPQDGDVFWTPADWAWIGGLMDALLPSLYFGKPIVASPPGRFDTEVAVRILRECSVRNAFLPPTALRMMRRDGVALDGLGLRTVMSGGESLDAATLEWFREATGLTIAEIYGQTEANYLVGNSPGLYEVRPGSMGLPYPGHEVKLIDETGNPVPVGETGEVALETPDPVAFLEYWNRPEATSAKYIGRSLRTGDLAVADEDGYLWFKGRADDLIISSGYRIAPIEVEACLLQHEGVAACAVVGVPDAIRGQVVKAFVVPAAASTVSEGELRDYVKRRLAAYESPRQIEFVQELPLTVTGKIKRRELTAQENPSAILAGPRTLPSG